MKQWIMQYWMGFAFASLTSIISFLWIQVTSTRSGLKALLRNEVIRIYEEWSDRGYIPYYVMEGLTHTYEAYHNLKGNGTITKLYKELQALPSNPPDELEGGDNSCLKQLKGQTSL